MDGNDVLDEIELFELTHAVSIDNALNALVADLLRSNVIDRSAVATIDAAYRKPLEKQIGNPLAVSVLKMHNAAFDQLLADPPVSPLSQPQ